MTETVRAPLTFGQLSVWRSIEHLPPDTTEANLSQEWDLPDGTDVSAVRRALDALERRHEALRTTFVPARARHRAGRATSDRGRRARGGGRPRGGPTGRRGDPTRRPRLRPRPGTGLAGRAGGRRGATAARAVRPPHGRRRRRPPHPAGRAPGAAGRRDARGRRTDLQGDRHRTARRRLGRTDARPRSTTGGAAWRTAEPGSRLPTPRPTSGGPTCSRSRPCTRRSAWPPG